ncbi:MAG: hypothetical protein QCI38_06480, partial [Candidatus Thermoplasmatota archaeon]|nr:hypothetical protein [Candidatus Thermoplasmatota archaeon]
YAFGQKLKWTSSHIVYALVIKLCLLFAFALPILTSKILPMMGYNISGITTLTGEPLLALPLLGDVDLYTLFFLFLVIPTQLFMVVRARGVHEREWWTKYIVIDIFFTWLAFAFMTVMVVDVLWSIFLFLLPFIWFAGTTTIMYGKPMRVGL